MSSVPAISSPATVPVKVNENASPALLADVAAEPHRVAVDRAGEIAGDEVALVRAVDLGAALAQVQARAWSVAAAYSIRTSQPPDRSAAGGAGVFTGVARRLAQHGVQAVGDDLLVARAPSCRA